MYAANTINEMRVIIDNALDDYSIKEDYSEGLRLTSSKDRIVDIFFEACQRDIHLNPSETLAMLFQKVFISHGSDPLDALASGQLLLNSNPDSKAYKILLNSCMFNPTDKSARLLQDLEKATILRNGIDQFAKNVIIELINNKGGGEPVKIDVAASAMKEVGGYINYLSENFTFESEGFTDKDTAEFRELCATYIKALAEHAPTPLTGQPLTEQTMIRAIDSFFKEVLDADLYDYIDQKRAPSLIVAPGSAANG